jgi:CRISPR-associated protein (TIGR02710 family)
MSDEASMAQRIETLSQAWRAMPRGTEAEKTASQRFYQEQVFPLVCEAFAAREAEKVSQVYDLAVMTAGGSPEALILSLSALRPAQVFFLHTAWSRSLEGIDQVVTSLGLKPSQFDKAQVNPDDTLDTYAGVKQGIAWAGNPARVVVDISGGKKSMSVAAGLAAYVIGADIVYVDNREFWQGLGKPKPGSEFLAMLSHPYTVFGDLAQREAERLYRQHDYGGAERIFARLAQDVPSVVDYLLLRHLSTAYHAWDRFVLPDACREMESLVDQLGRRRILEPQLKLMPYITPLAAQAATLGRLRPLTGQLKKAHAPDLDLLQNQAQAADLIFSLYANALRREEERRLDLAALLLYRVLEMLAQRRLALMGIDTSAPDYDRLPIPLSESAWQEAVQSCLRRTPQGGLPGKLGLVDDYILLFTQEDPLVDKLDWGRMQNAIESRNQSIFAHGFRFLSPKAYDGFRRLVDERLAAFCRAEGLDFESLAACSRFVQPFEPGTHDESEHKAG